MAGIASIARGGSVGYPVRVLIARKGDMTFENLLRRLRCKRCRAVKPAPVYLVAGHHRTRRGDPDADWSIALAPPCSFVARGAGGELHRPRPMVGSKHTARGHVLDSFRAFSRPFLGASYGQRCVSIARSTAACFLSLADERHSLGLRIRSASSPRSKLRARPRSPEASPRHRDSECRT
jgi:hypothetical protein